MRESSRGNNRAVSQEGGFGECTSSFRYWGTSECIFAPVLVLGNIQMCLCSVFWCREHPPKTPFWKPPFCEPPKSDCHDGASRACREFHMAASDLVSSHQIEASFKEKGRQRRAGWQSGRLLCLEWQLLKPAELGQESQDSDREKILCCLQVFYIT